MNNVSQKPEKIYFGLDISQKNIEIYYCRKTKSEFTVVFENENTIDTWRVKLAAEFNRAQRADISLVNTNISLEFFNTIIRPQTYLTYYPDNIMYWNPIWSKRCKYVN